MLYSQTGEGFHAVTLPANWNYITTQDLAYPVDKFDDSVYYETKRNTSCVIRPKTDQTKPKFTKINFVKSDENVKSVNKENTHKHGKKGTGKDQSHRAATLISTARPVNTAAPKSKVNDALPKTYSYFKAHSPVRRDFNQKSAAKTYNLNEKVKTIMVNNVTIVGPKAVVSAAVGYGENVVKSSACWIWRPAGNVIDHTSLKTHALNWDNKSVLSDYQEVEGGFVAFAGSPKGSINRDSTVSPYVSTAGQSFTNSDDLPTDPLMPDLEDIADLLNTGIFSGAYDEEDVGAKADLNNLETTMNVSPIPTTRIHKDHPKDRIIRDINSATQIRRMTKIFEEHAMVSYIKKQRRTNHKIIKTAYLPVFSHK
ncbi:hypothetical protein Tco_0278014 [Tanacetum coccineum]